MLFSLSSVFPRQEINLDGPTIPAPNGTVSMLDNPPNGNHIAIPIITVCTVISAVFYVTRFYAKYLARNITVADYLTVVTFPLYWVYIYYCYRLSWTSGYLVHEWDIPLKDITAFSYVCWLATLLYLWIIALVKCSILLEWTRIFVPKGKQSYFTSICYAVCAATSALSIIIFIMDLVNCTPFARNYDPLIPGGFCRFEVTEFGLASSTTNFVLNLIPLALAQKVIWGLHNSWQRKLGVSIIFLIGILGCVASLVRLYYATRFYISDDTTYYFSIMKLCSLSETTCANLVLSVAFTPRAIMGVKQTKVFTGLKEYMTLKSNSTYANNSKAFREAEEIPSAAKPKDDWIVMSSMGTGTDTACSEDLDRILRQLQPNDI